MLLAFGKRARAFASWSSLVLAAGLVAACDKPAAGPPSPDASASASTSTPAPAPIAAPPEPRPGEYDQPRRVLARIQGNLERVADGKEPVKLPAGVEADPLEALVGAYKVVLASDPAAADALAKVAALAKARLDEKVSSALGERGREKASTPKGHEIETYTKHVSVLALEKPKGPDGLMLQLAATMRLVDAALVMESGHKVYDDAYDLFDRADLMLLRSLDHFRDDTWLRLPCRTILGRRALVEAAAKRLGQAAGPLLSCPTPEKHELDFELMERFAKDPGESAAAVRKPRKPETRRSRAIEPTPAAPAPPWDRDAAIVFMGENPDAAEKPLEAASKKDVVGKLDYALFLHTFRPQSAARDAKIKKLLGEVVKASTAAAKKNNDELLIEEPLFERRDYDGTDESLLGLLRFASSSTAAETTSSFYAIPCAVLVARPKLVDATEPLYGTSRDNFLPRSGCGWGRGFVRGFPDVEFEQWIDAAEEADGKFLWNFSGTMRFALASGKNVEAETMRTNPRKLLEGEAPPMAWPYETWSYMTPESRAIYQNLLRIAEPLKAKLVAHYKTRGLDEKEAERAAHTGLFRVVWGASCGDKPPPLSLRKRVVDGASAADLRVFIAAGETKNAASLLPFQACAKITGMDPLVHMAVLNPAALPVLWEISVEPGKERELDLVVDPNAPNDFGKTPLMAAAQQNRVESARILLQRGAAVDRTTFQTTEPLLGHDARTALMYAAARGSLPMIRLLLDAGADKYAADTKGLRAVDYLLGHGPVPANSVLSPAELAEAAKLLY
ncbi:ankyrin repeat domain-containing protein [Polyangium sp. 15x6]|uniref:ankyrin repeat domain-containing protein n=1 Tax=Polyangium sp. 15x6 TaxID=3042687 RepID=UPI00249A9902|nr:ankyrin repeat domain-containing protein [Polyangium sp. 15x6]MDI3282650.1 ankyrin repeat domain-containing protein [Polyangium sp. 15x6]